MKIFTKSFYSWWQRWVYYLYELNIYLLEHQKLRTFGNIFYKLFLLSISNVVRTVFENVWVYYNMIVTNSIYFSFRFTNEILKQKIHSNLALILIHVVVEKGAKDRRRKIKKMSSKIVYTSSISTSNELFIYHNVNAFEMIFQIIYNAFRYVCSPLLCISIYLSGMMLYAKAFRIICINIPLGNIAMHVGNIDSGSVLLYSARWNFW